MPEGDTIAKLARFLDAALADQIVSRVQIHPAFGSESVGGAVGVEQVVAHGKHLYVHFASGRVLRSHLGLYGSWHRYRHNERWRRPRRQASIRLFSAPWEYVCFNAKSVEWLQDGGFRLADQHARLGPDLITESLQLEGIVATARRLLPAQTWLVDLLLDQRVAAGIGNVYKSELLFIQRHGPLTRMGQVDDHALAELYREAARLLSANLGGGARKTRADQDGRGPLWVYGRAAQPCLRCGDGQIQRAALGAQPRVTYWCPGCQTPLSAG